MIDLLKNILVPIKETQEIRGITLPIGLEYLQLVVTGPPGAGKSYYINQIRGWPNEGYIDLSKNGWWRDKSLIYRPREVHLGMPFAGFAEALTVFDKEWIESIPAPPLDLERVKIPPAGEKFFQTNWLNRYIFEFLLPPPGVIYKQRKARRNQGYFPVDVLLSEDMVVRQVQAYQEIAIYLHRAGLNIYIRRGIDEPPMYISEKGVAAVPRWTIIKKPPRPSLKTMAGWSSLFLGRDQGEWLTLSEEPVRLEGTSRIAHDGKSFELLLGGQTLHFRPEIPLGVKRHMLQKTWIINTPQACSATTPNCFARLQDGETVIIGRSNKEYDEILQFSKAVAKRHVAITNKRGDLSISVLDEQRGVSVARFDDFDYRERLETERYKALVEFRELYGGPIELLTPDQAMTQIQQVNRLMAEEPLRPLAESGRPGAIVELKQRALPVIAGDLHAQVDNLLKILTENCLLACLGRKSATLILLGDAVHSENIGEMEDMDSSILIMDLIFTLKLRYPENFYYLRGNHDSFHPDISKNTISQGVLMRERLVELRGEEYALEMEKYLSLLPYVIISPYFYGCHAAPPRITSSYDDLINITDHPTLCKEITSNRLQRPNYLHGYNKSDIKKFRKALGVAKGTPFVVGHTPQDPFSSVWKNVGSIKNHHIIYSAHQRGPTILQQAKKELIPLSYPVEPLIKLINGLSS